MNDKSLFYWAKHWIRHPAYFVFCFAVGVYIWSFSFESKKSNINALTFSLQTSATNEVRLNEEKAASRLPASAQTSKSKLPKRFKGNPAFQIIEKLKEIVE